MVDSTSGCSRSRCFGCDCNVDLVSVQIIERDGLGYTNRRPRFDDGWQGQAGLLR